MAAPTPLQGSRELRNTQWRIFWLIHYFTRQYCLHTHRPTCGHDTGCWACNKPCLALTRMPSDAFRSASCLSGQMWVNSNCMAKRLFPTCLPRQGNATPGRACYTVASSEIPTLGTCIWSVLTLPPCVRLVMQMRHSFNKALLVHSAAGRVLEPGKPYWSILMLFSSASIPPPFLPKTKPI